MAWKEKPIEKMTTAKASEILGITPQDLNYWAKRIGVRKVNKGRRKVYSLTEAHIDAIRILKNKPKSSQTTEAAAMLNAIP